MFVLFIGLKIMIQIKIIDIVTKQYNAKIDFPQPYLFKKNKMHIWEVLISWTDIWMVVSPANKLCANNVSSCMSILLLPPSGERRFQIDFVRSIVHQYIRFEPSAQKNNVSIPNLESTVTNGHFLEPNSQGWFKYCKKNCSMICLTCNVRLHVNFFPLHHSY